VTIVERRSAGFQQRECRAGEQVVLDDPRLTFAVDELYAGIAFDPG